MPGLSDAGVPAVRRELLRGRRARPEERDGWVWVPHLRRLCEEVLGGDGPRSDPAGTAQAVEA